MNDSSFAVQRFQLAPGDGTFPQLESLEAGAASCFRELLAAGTAEALHRESPEVGWWAILEALCYVQKQETSIWQTCCLPGIDEFIQPCLAAALILWRLLEDCDKWCTD